VTVIGRKRGSFTGQRQGRPRGDDHQINTERREAVRQLRLRDIGGSS